MLSEPLAEVLKSEKIEKIGENQMGKSETRPVA
jgi:hypothetical protein